MHVVPLCLLTPKVLVQVHIWDENYTINIVSALFIIRHIKRGGASHTLFILTLHRYANLSMLCMRYLIHKYWCSGSHILVLGNISIRYVCFVVS
jgi:hypothetical protein